MIIVIRTIERADTWESSLKDNGLEGLTLSHRDYPLIGQSLSDTTVKHDKLNLEGLSIQNLKFQTQHHKITILTYIFSLVLIFQSLVLQTHLSNLEPQLYNVHNFQFHPLWPKIKGPGIFSFLPHQTDAQYYMYYKNVHSIELHIQGSIIEDYRSYKNNEML